MLLKPKNLELTVNELRENVVVNELKKNEEPPLQKLIKEGHTHDDFVMKILNTLSKELRHSKKITLRDCEEHERLLYYQNCLYVSNYKEIRTKVCELHHDLSAADHGERTKTLKLIHRQYFWPELRSDVSRYVHNCHICRRSKPCHHKPYADTHRQAHTHRHTYTRLYT